MKRVPVFVQKAGWRGATSEHIPGGSVSEEQRSQAAFCAKTLRAARLLSVASVGSLLTARFGDARNSPPWPRAKSAAAGPLIILIQALSAECGVRSAESFTRESLLYFAGFMHCAASQKSAFIGVHLRLNPPLAKYFVTRCTR